MIYTKEVENMCPVAKGAKHEPAAIPERSEVYGFLFLQVRKRESGFIPRKLRTFQDLHTVSAGVHHSRVPASFLLT